MNVSGVKGFSSVSPYFKAASFKGNKNEDAKNANSEYYNPVNVSTERKLAVLSSVGISAVAGAVVAGVGSLLSGNKLFSKLPLLLGAAGALITLALTLPSKLYNTKVNATVKEKEMDVFTADRELKKDLTREVHQEVKDPEVSLDKKLDDNLKLSLANKGAALGFKTL